MDNHKAQPNILPVSECRQKVWRTFSGSVTGWGKKQQNTQYEVRTAQLRPGLRLLCQLAGRARSRYSAPGLDLSGAAVA